ncbi:cupin domain-containing protein [Aeromicrobium sp. 9AM]|uniref:cupin domain-containing protein n=1 Tax=Aeromicrobium sp. 9AM TaxID=2653126 RepID=UPI0012F299D8|nr:cupin domain-containing protein [Aeromicrobium sp. 9AM]VXB27795.1 Cupin [Aeromicrobium sp. 9AM]
MNNTAAPTSIVKAATEGERRWFAGGGVHTWKVRAKDSDGAFLMFEDRMEQGKVTPLHFHPETDEMFMVLEGEILMHLDGTEQSIAEGGMMLATRGLPHAFMVTSPFARMLCLQTPGNIESFFWDASDPIADDVSTGEVDFDRIAASGQRNGGMVLLGPPPFAH